MKILPLINRSIKKNLYLLFALISFGVIEPFELHLATVLTQ